MAEDMKIVVTGASGHLGSNLIPQLVKAGYAVHGIDRVAVTGDSAGHARIEFTAADLTDRAKLDAALAGAGLVVHCASIHPWRTYPDEEYFDANEKGTWALYRGCVDAGIERVVLTSSVAAVGYGMGTADSWPLGEEYAGLPLDLYSLTKQTQETIARQFQAVHGVRTIALRPPAFMPLGEAQTGHMLLGVYALVDDIVAAHVAAVETILGKRETPRLLEPFEAFYTTNQHPYVDDDVALMDGESVTVELAAKYWPEAAAWLRETGFAGAWSPAVYDNAKARDMLGWQARMDFSAWFARHIASKVESA